MCCRGIWWGALFCFATAIFFPRLAYGDFTTIYNVPPDPAPAAIGSNTQLNLFYGGALPTSFDAGASDGSSTEVEVNVLGGRVGPQTYAFGGSVINLAGGMLGHGFNAWSGSTVNISAGVIEGRITTTSFLARSGSVVNATGGVLGQRFSTSSGATVRLHGDEFRLDGVPIGGLNVIGDAVPVNVPSGSLLTGVLSDGTTFLLGGLGSIANNTLTLELTTVPVAPAVLQVPSDPAPAGLRTGQELTLLDGGSLPEDFTAVWGSTLNVQGGSVGEGLQVGGADVNISGGTVGDYFLANKGSVVTISGGSVGEWFRVGNGSVVNVEGGEVGSRLTVALNGQLNVSGGSLVGVTADNGSVVHVSGGIVGLLSNSTGSTTTISGGAVGGFSAATGFGLPDPEVRILGNDFRINGTLIPGLDNIGDAVQYDHPAAPWVISCTLADGTPFMVSSEDVTSMPNDVVVLERAAVASGPATFNVPTDQAPYGVHQGQSLSLSAGGELGNHFAAGWGSTVDISGGVVGRDFEAVGAVVTISGGKFGNDMDASVESQINLSGGSIGNSFHIDTGATVQVSGGTIGDGFQARDGSDLTLSGAEFRLDGAIIGGLENVGDEISLNIPSGTLLSGTLADGTPFAFQGQDSVTNSERISDGTLTLKRASLPVPGPALIEIDSDSSLLGVRGGQTLVIHDGGSLGDHFNAGLGSFVTMESGTIGENFEAVSAQFTMHDGSVGDNFDAYGASVVNIEGGTVGDRMEVMNDSILSISGGTVGDNLTMRPGTTLNISGGSVGELLILYPGTTLNLSGGSIGPEFVASHGSTVNMSGGTIGHPLFSGGSVYWNFLGLSFQIDGVPIEGLVPGEPLPITDVEVVLTGTLADGSFIEFPIYENLEYGPDFITVTLATIPEPATSDILAIAMVVGLLLKGTGAYRRSTEPCC